MNDRPEPPEVERSTKTTGIGFAGTLASINIVVMGSVTWMFAFGPYLSATKEIWYRYGSIAFLFLGAILPTAALSLIARRFPILVIILTLWMCVALLAFLIYMSISGGVV